MKLVAFLLGGLGVAQCAAQCGQGQVPDVNNLCIQPQYIQGCQKYASNSACQECQYSTTSIIQHFNCKEMEAANSPQKPLSPAAWNLAKTANVGLATWAST